MDFRSSKILNWILNRQELSLHYLSEVFDISEQMLRKLIRELNAVFREKEIPTIKILSDGKLKYSEMSEEHQKKIKEILLENDFYTYRLTPNERKTISSMILMNSNRYVTATEISEYLEISRNTALNDLNDLKEWFLLNNMKLHSQVQKGYKVEGSEENIRSGMMKLLELNLDYYNYGNGEILDTFQHLLLRELHYEDRMPVIQRIVKEEENRHDLFLSDFSFMELIIELLVLLKRQSNGAIYPETISIERRKSSKYPMSRDILLRLGDYFDLTIPDVEIRYFVQCLRKKSYLKSSTTNVEEIAVPIMIGEAIYQISNRFNISFYLDFALYDVLVDHIKSAVYRAKSGEVLHNPFGKEIEEKYPEIFKVVKQCMKPLEQYIGMPFKKNEITFLTMYFASMIEKDRIERMRNQKVSVLLVGGMGRGVMQLLTAELGQFDDIIHIAGIKSSHEADSMEAYEADMIISTVPYTHKSIECIQISGPILDDSAIFEIRTMATKVLNEKCKHTYIKKAEIQELNQRKNSFLTRDRILLDVESASWEEAVRLSGNLLYQDGIVTKEYVDAMVDNVKINGNYIVIYPDLAIPHAEPSKGALKEGISLVRLKQPVVFEGKEEKTATYIVGLSLMNAKSINDLFYNLIKMFSNPTYRKQMKQVKTEWEMYRLIRKIL
ncbi:MAG: PRD domain-containing protein [Eubacteriales bacterium]|nr:PRD domain-containing protein [Eubacteriales bacterium]